MNFYRVCVTVIHTLNGPPQHYLEMTRASSSELARGNIAARYWKAHSYEITSLREAH